MSSVDPDAIAADELCRIIQSCAHEPPCERVHTLKRELHCALRRAFYWQDCARHAEHLLALRDAPKSNDSGALRAMRRAVRAMRERCALLEARCFDLLSVSQPEDTQPIVLPPARLAPRGMN